MKPITNSRLKGESIRFLGTNQSNMRELNEKLVLTIIRKHGAMSKAEIAKKTSLSAQTVSVITRELEADQLLIKGSPVRGKVGQPSVPISLNPQGAFFLGLKIGRRSVEIMLIDFCGGICGCQRSSYDFPTIDGIMTFTVNSIELLLEEAGPRARERVRGMGVAMPFELWNWAKLIGFDHENMTHWKGYDIREELSSMYRFPVYVQNDASAACAAELTFGSLLLPDNFLYFYIGYFVGGGVVINNALQTGTRGNAGALGSIQVTSSDGTEVQLLETSSLAVLEELLHDKGFSSEFLWESKSVWGLPPDIQSLWIDICADGIAQAIRSATAVIDFEATLIDGFLPAEILEELTDAVCQKYQASDLTGLSKTKILQGTIHTVARSLGAASLPLAEQFVAEI